MTTNDVILYSGGAAGAESAFGANAEKLGIDEVNFSFEGHEVTRLRGTRILNHEELKNGDVSLAYVSKLMNRQYHDTSIFRKIIQTIWYQINSSTQIFVVGEILPDNTVKGGTGWGAEFAKLCNKELFVFDQEKNGWFKWNQAEWTSVTDPVISEIHFCGTGTRMIKENSIKAIDALFARSFQK